MKRVLSAALAVLVLGCSSAFAAPQASFGAVTVKAATSVAKKPLQKPAPEVKK